MRLHRILIAFVSLALIVALSGCVAFVGGSPSAAQRDLIGDIEVSSTICASQTGEGDGTVDWPGCGDADVAGGNAKGKSGYDAVAGNYQLLTGYRIPDGSQSPDSFVTDEAPGNGSLTFVRNTHYSGELERLVPTPDGMHWVGYLSGPFTHTGSPDATAHRLRFSPEFTLPRPADGTPFVGPFEYTQVIGVRQISGAYPLDRPVVCGATTSEQADNGYCIDAPANPSTGRFVGTRDLGILPAGGEQPAVHAGGSVGVAFTAKYAGTAAAGANFSLEAGTAAPGASATPSQPSLAPPSNSTTQLSVNVAVPASTPPGLYDVTLTARLPNGQTRTGTRQIQVMPAPAGGASGAGGSAGTGGSTGGAGGTGGSTGTGGSAGSSGSGAAAPKATLRVPRGQTIRSLLSDGLRVRVALDKAGNVKSDLLAPSALAARSVKLASKTTAFAAAGAKTIRLKLGRKARRQTAAALRRASKVRLTLRGTAADSAGNRSTTALRVTLKR
jgi:hypothetical protein